MFERTLLRRHLQRCGPCAEYAHRVREVTELVRAAPLEPTRVSAVWRRPRRGVLIVRSATVTLAVAAAAIWLTVTSLQTSQQRPPATGVPGAAASGTATDDRHDWSAGLPHSVKAVQLIPGGLYTSNLSD